MKWGGPVGRRDPAIGISHQHRGKRQRIGYDEQPHPELLGADRIRRTTTRPERIHCGGFDIGHQFVTPKYKIKEVNKPTSHPENAKRTRKHLPPAACQERDATPATE